MNVNSPLYLLPNELYPQILALPANDSTKARLESLLLVDKGMHQKMLQVIGHLLREQHITIYDVPMLRTPKGFLSFCGTELAKRNMTCLPAMGNLISCMLHRFSEQDGDQHKKFRDTVLKLISSDITSLPNLTEIDLIDNNCTMLSSLKNRTNLTSLKIACGANDTVKRVVELTQLKKLSINFLLRVGKSTQNEFLSLGQCTNLQHLQLSSHTHAMDTSELDKDTFPGVFSRLTRLTNLLVDHCPDIDKMQHIAFPTTLKTLRLSSCTTITNDAVIRKIAPLTQLTFLDLSLCSDITDLGIQSLTSLTDLMTLKISACDQIAINGISPLTCLKNLATLTNDLLTQTTIPQYKVHLETV